MTISEIVKNVRVKLKLTQAELSKLSGIPVVTIARWESQSTKPRAKQWGTFLDFCKSHNIKVREDNIHE